MKILFWDNGLNTELAVSFVRAGHKVAYSTPWQEAFPKSGKAYIGKGLDGLEAVDSFSKALLRSDCVICPDTFSADRVEQARQAGKPVWGAGAAERLELDRPYMKDQQRLAGLPVGKYDEINGIDNLLKYLQDPANKDRWIKTSKWRQMETFHHVDWDSTKVQYVGPLLDAYGAAANEMTWLAERTIKGVEVGADCLFANGEWANEKGYGYEAKDEAYVGTHAPRLPDILAKANTVLAGLLKTAGANSFVSSEIRVTPEKIGFMIEPTIRCPHPPTAGMLEMYENLPEWILEELRFGINNKPRMRLKAAHRYCAVLVIRSSWAGDHWLQLEIDEKFRHLIKLSQACRIGGKYFAVPGNEFVAYAVGCGESLVSAANVAKKAAAAFRCRDMDCNEAALDKLVEETVPEGRKVGIEF